MKNVVLTVVALLMIAFVGKAQSKPEEIMDKFFKTLQEKTPEKAYEYIYSDNKALESNQEQIDVNKTGFINLTGQFGKYFGFDLVTKEETGKCVVKYTYLLKYEKAPMRIIVTFYNPAEQWKILEFTYTRQIDDKANFNSRQMPFRNTRPMQPNIPAEQQKTR